MQDHYGQSPVEEQARGWGYWLAPVERKKGHFGGQCQRFACVNPHSHWLNERDGFYYCWQCAATFNEAALRVGQRPPCVCLDSHPT